MIFPQFPAEVHRYVNRLFAAANKRTSEKIARVPNCSEPSLDLTLVEHLSQFASPHVVAPGWAVRMDVHYLGGLRHFRQWEVADIGVLLFVRHGSKVVAKKAAILQSKRLYPDGEGILEESVEDYQIGFGNLLPSEGLLPQISTSHLFKFAAKSRYKALRIEDEQYKAIEEYEAAQKLPVHYLFYNPWTVPTTYKYPVQGPIRMGPKGNGGCRVVAAKSLRMALANKSKGYSPTFQDLKVMIPAGTHEHGWRLETFMSNLFMKCKEGHRFERLDEENMYSLFYRRSGPIAAAIAITVEQFRD